MADALPPQPQSERCLVLEPRRAADAGATLCRVTLPALTRDRVPPAPAGVAGTLPAHHASVAASPAQSPKIMATETLTARAFADECATVTSEAASALVWKGARSRGLPRTYTLRLATNPGPTRASADLTGSRAATAPTVVGTINSSGRGPYARKAGIEAHIGRSSNSCVTTANRSHLRMPSLRPLTTSEKPR